MFGSLGGAELLAVLFVALLLFGPRKLPQIGRTMGRALSELRKATTDFKRSLDREVGLEEMKAVRGGLQAAGQEMTAMVEGQTGLEADRDRPAGNAHETKESSGDRVVRSEDGGGAGAGTADGERGLPDASRTGDGAERRDD